MTDRERHTQEERTKWWRVFRNWCMLIGTPLVILALFFSPSVNINPLSWVSRAAKNSRLIDVGIIAIFATLALLHLFKYKPRVKVTGYPIKTDPFNPKVGDGIRFVIFITFHGIVGFAVWKFLDIYVFQSLLGGNGLIFEILRIGFWLGLIASVYVSFDMSSIELNHAAELLYFGKPRFSNIPHGFFCLGIPRWLGTELQIVDCGLKMITFGVMEGQKKQPFIVECAGFRAIFDVAFSVKANNTRIFLNLRGDVQKQLVTAMNEVIYRFVNMRNANGSLRFPDINSLKAATAILSNEILTEEPNEQNKGETARVLMARLGHELISVDVKDVENEDTAIIRAQQDLEARRILEKAEMLDAQNMVEKVNLLYKDINHIGTAEELPVKERVSKAECVKIIERIQGGRKTIDVTGKGTPFVDART